MPKAFMRRRRTSLLILVALTLGMAGCGGSSKSPASESTVLPGSSTAPAIQAIVNVKLPPVTSADISADGLLLNRINVFFALTATIGEVNEVAKAINGTIAYSRLNSTMVEFAIPRQSGQAALLAMAAQLEQRSGVASASTSRTEQVQELPRDNVGGLANAADFQQLLAARFPAAWHARALLAGCEARPVTILVTDKFSPSAPAGFVSGIPAANFLEDPDPLLDLAIEPNDHGFLVTAAMAGAHDGSLPTGAHPEVRCLLIEQLAMNGLSSSDSLDKLANRLARNGENVIVQSSLGFNTGFESDESLSALGAPEVERRARDALKSRIWSTLRWAEFGLSSTTNSNTLIFLAAGNERNDTIGGEYSGFGDTRVGANAYSLVRTLPNLSQNFGLSGLGVQFWTPTNLAAGAPLAPVHLSDSYLAILQAYFDRLGKSSLAQAPNVATVGATVSERFNAPSFPAADFSNSNADLHAVGEDLKLGSPNPNAMGRDDHRGTSFAAPQVSGLAAYLWLLSDELRGKDVAETLKLLSATAQVGQGTSGFIDAYAAVLALDSPEGNQRVRRAILDVNDDGGFDDVDINLYLAAMERPASRDYSRFDLNGDGFTQSGNDASPRAVAMDLDAAIYASTGAPVLQAIRFAVDEFEGAADENAVTDMMALCYFAYSEAPELYSGTRAARTAALGPDRCAEQAVMNVVFPQSFSGPANLSVELEMKDEEGVLQPVVGAVVEVVAACASATPSTGLSSSEGLFSATIVANAGCTQVVMQIIARNQNTNAVIAQRQVSATVGTGFSGGTVTISKTVAGGSTSTTTFAGVTTTTVDSSNETGSIEFTFSGNGEGNLVLNGTLVGGSINNVQTSTADGGGCPFVNTQEFARSGQLESLASEPGSIVVGGEAGPAFGFSFPASNSLVGPGTITETFTNDCTGDSSVDASQTILSFDMSIPGEFTGLSGSSSGTIDLGLGTTATFTVSWNFNLR